MRGVTDAFQFFNNRRGAWQNAFVSQAAQIPIKPFFIDILINGYYFNNHSWPLASTWDQFRPCLMFEIVVGATSWCRAISAIVIPLASAALILGMSVSLSLDVPCWLPRGLRFFEYI